MKRFFYIVMFILLASCESCGIDPNPKTELEKLPAATQQGKHTFGCLVNGKAWVTSNSIDALAFYQSGALQISAGIKEKERNQDIDLIVLNGLAENTSYDLTNDPTYEADFNWVLPAKTCYYGIENTIKGQLIIKKLDQTNLIISGLFEFTTVTSGCDTIKVTDGRFDLTYAN